jgi:tetratricopeptide (TPR) repeat protein
MKLFGTSLAIFVATVWLFWPCVRGEFLDTDDKDYLQQAAAWNGFTWTAIKRSFTITQPYYHPLPRLSHVLDYQLWGDNPAAHHASSVVLHALNAALVFGFVWTLLGAVTLTTGERLAIAAGVAVVFAMHPFQVESVAWIAGRTQLLCATFEIACLWVYVAGGSRWTVGGLFVMALLCKPTAVSLPFVMLALDFYPLRRHEQAGWGRLVWQKAPMLVLVVVAGTISAVTETNSLMPWSAAAPSDRLLMTFQALVFYPYRLICPWHICPFYPLRLRPSLLEWKVVVSVLGVGLVTAVALWRWRRLPSLAAAWAAYIALVLPVSGLTLGLGAVAPRHAYIALLPLLLLAGAAIVWAWRHSQSAVHGALTLLLAGQLCVFAIGTRRLIPEWHNEETLRRAVVASFPDSEFDCRVLALVLLEQGRFTEAFQYATRAVAIAPQQCHAHSTLASVLRRLGRQQEAMAEDIQAFQLNPSSAQAHYNFGVALVDSGKPSEAVEHFQQALSMQPDMPSAHRFLGLAWYQMGRVPEAIEQFETALQLDPEDGGARNNLGVALARSGRIEEGIALLEQALKMKEDSAELHNNLGIALTQAGRLEEAVAHFERALRLNPDYADAHYHLGTTLERIGKTQEAMSHFEQALRINPEFAEAQNSLGINLARQGKTDEALGRFDRALKLKPDYAEADFNLAVVLEMTGRVPEAVQHYESALKLQPDFAAARNALARLRTNR